MGGSLVEIRMAKHLGGVRRIDVPEPSVYSWFLSLDGNRVLIDSIVETEDASTHNLQTYDLSLERVISKDRRKGIFEYIGGSPKLNLYVSEESEGALVQENIGRIDGIPK